MSARVYEVITCLPGDGEMTVSTLTSSEIASHVLKSRSHAMLAVTIGKFEVKGERASCSAYFPGDPYSESSVFRSHPGRASPELVTAWSPTQPMYKMKAGASECWLFADDLEVLKSVADKVGESKALDDRFAIWTLTGLPAAQFGLSPMRTPWSALKQVPAGVRVRQMNDELVYSRAPQAIWEVDVMSMPRARECVSEAFMESVAACVGDCSTTILASGGIDSSAIAGACSQLGVDFDLLTNVYLNAPETDERAFVLALSSALGIPCQAIGGRAASLLLHACRQARPFRGLFRADDQDVIEYARSGDKAVVLDGLGGDELFAVRDFPVGSLSNRSLAKDLLPSTSWKAIYGRRHRAGDNSRLLPPFVVGVDERELLWEFQFRGLTEMDCPNRFLKRLYSMMFESNHWEEARWLSLEVFGRHGVRRRHPYLSTNLMRAVLSVPNRAFRLSPVVKEFQRLALNAFLPEPIATRYGGAEQTANVMFNYLHSLSDFAQISERSCLGANRLIDPALLGQWYAQGLEPTAVYCGGSVEFDHLWSTICYDRWLEDWQVSDVA